jgi:hypothetical protein
MTMPTEVIKIIVDYLSENDLTVYQNLDILPYVEKMFNLKKLKKEMVKSYSYDNCNCLPTRGCTDGTNKKKNCRCPLYQKKYPENYYYFTFHKYYPQSFLEWMMENCFIETTRKESDWRSGHHQTRFNSLSLEQREIAERKNKLPIDTRANINLSFLEKYVDEKYHYLYQNDDPMSGVNRCSSSFITVGRRTHQSWKDDDGVDKKECFEPNFRLSETSKLSTAFIERVETKRTRLLPVIVRNICLTEEFVEEKMNDGWRGIWPDVMSNPNMSSEFLLRHLKTTIKQMNSGYVYGKVLIGLMQHPSFLTLWKTYLEFIPENVINILDSHQLYTRNEDGSVIDYYLCEDFFKVYSNFLPIKHVRLSKEFLMNYQFPKAKADSKFYDGQYDIFANQHIGQSAIVELLSTFSDANSDAKVEKKKEEKTKKKKYPEKLIEILNDNHSLTDDFWENHRDLIRWGQLNRVKENTGKGIDKSTISCNPNLSPKFIFKYKNRLNLSYVFRYNKLLPLHFLKQALTDFLSETRKVNKN